MGLFSHLTIHQPVAVREKEHAMYEEERILRGSASMKEWPSIYNQYHERAFKKPGGVKVIHRGEISPNRCCNCHQRQRTYGI